MSAEKNAVSPPLSISKVPPFPQYLYICHDSINNRLRMYIGNDSLNFSGEKPSVWLSKCYASIFDPQSQKVKRGIVFSEREIITRSGMNSGAQFFYDIKPSDLRDLFCNGALVIHFTAILTLFGSTPNNAMISHYSCMNLIIFIHYILLGEHAH